MEKLEFNNAEFTATQRFDKPVHVVYRNCVFPKLDSGDSGDTIDVFKMKDGIFEFYNCVFPGITGNSVRAIRASNNSPGSSVKGIIAGCQFYDGHGRSLGSNPNAFDCDFIVIQNYESVGDIKIVGNLFTTFDSQMRLGRCVKLQAASNVEIVNNVCDYPWIKLGFTAAQLGSHNVLVKSNNIRCHAHDFVVVADEGIKIRDNDVELLGSRPQDFIQVKQDLNTIHVSNNSVRGESVTMIRGGNKVETIAE